MGKSDRVEQLLAQARRRHTAASVEKETSLSAYIAPKVVPNVPGAQTYEATGDVKPIVLNSSPRRYAGRSQHPPASVQGNLARGASPHVEPTATGRGPAVPLAWSFARTVSLPWSLRLGITVALLSVLLVAWRAPGISTLPIDSPVGVEATNAAFVNILTESDGVGP